MHTEETEWKSWDAPWENLIERTEEEFRDFLNKMLKRHIQKIPKRLQISYKDQTYIGWVSTYLYENEQKRAIGIDIPPQDYRKKAWEKKLLNFGWHIYLK